MARDWLPGEIPRPSIHVRVTADTSEVTRKLADIQRLMAHRETVDWFAVLRNAAALAYAVVVAVTAVALVLASVVAAVR